MNTIQPTRTHAATPTQSLLTQNTKTTHLEQGGAVVVAALPGRLAGRLALLVRPEEVRARLQQHPGELWLERGNEMGKGVCKSMRVGGVTPQPHPPLFSGLDVDVCV